jgi:4-hydroxybutyrate CoA-transferase
VRHIKSGNRVVVAHASGSPEILLKALVENKDAYKNVELVHMVSMGASEYCLPEMEKHFIHNSLFAGATTRKAIHTAGHPLPFPTSARSPGCSRTRSSLWM